MRITRTHIIIAGALVLGAAGVARLLRPRRLEVETASVTKQPLEMTIDAEGRTRVRERYVVAAPVSGRVHRITLLEGTPVKAGQVVAWIAPLPLDAATSQQARARLDGAQALAREAETRVRLTAASLTQRQRELKRAQRVFEAGGLAPRDIEEVQLAVRQAEEDSQAATERSRAAQADVNQARATLLALGEGRTAAIPLRAPASGAVLRVPERSERVVAAGTPVMEVGDPRTLEVVVDVLSSDGASVAPGDVVHLDHWGGSADGSGILDGCVRLVEPAAFTKVSALGVDEQRVNIVVDVTDPPTSIGDGFRVEAHIVTWRSAAALTVPTSALVRHGSEWTAFVVADGRSAARRVRVGHTTAARAEVLDGLRDGDSVVLFPSDALADGLRVLARSR